MIVVGVLCHGFGAKFAAWATVKSHGTKVNVEILYVNGSEHNEHMFVGVINGLGMNCREVDTQDHAGK